MTKEEALAANYAAIRANEKRVKSYNNGKLYNSNSGSSDRTAFDPQSYSYQKAQAANSSGASTYSDSGGGGATYSAPDYTGLINNLKGTLENSLNQSIAARQAAYDKSKQAYEANRDAALKSLLDAYNFGSGQVNDTADRSLQEAYLTRMQNQRTLPQMLSAQGITGGLSETTNANLLNSYGNNRNNIEVDRADNLASLLNTYQTGKAQTEQDFNTKQAEAYNTLQQGIAADRAAYNNSLASIMAYLG